jgi:hypothetical protein
MRAWTPTDMRTVIQIVSVKKSRMSSSSLALLTYSEEQSLGRRREQGSRDARLAVPPVSRLADHPAGDRSERKLERMEKNMMALSQGQHWMELSCCRRKGRVRTAVRRGGPALAVAGMGQALGCRTSAPIDTGRGRARRGSCKQKSTTSQGAGVSDVRDHERAKTERFRQSPCMRSELDRVALELQGRARIGGVSRDEQERGSGALFPTKDLRLTVISPPRYDPRFFLFFSLRKPAPRVTIRSAEAFAP